ncbi:hypothetical protein VTK26DRAFT_1131 [Humicola hyalothermophila]
MDRKMPSLPRLTSEELANPQTSFSLNGIVVRLWQVAHLFGLDFEVPEAGARAGATAADIRGLYLDRRREGTAPPSHPTAVGEPDASAASPTLPPADAASRRRQRQTEAGEESSEDVRERIRAFYRQLDEAAEATWGAGGRQGAGRADLARNLRRTRSEIGSGAWPPCTLPPPAGPLPPVPPLPPSLGVPGQGPSTRRAPMPTPTPAPATPTGTWRSPGVMSADPARTVVTSARRGPPPVSLHNIARGRQATAVTTAGSPGPAVFGTSRRKLRTAGSFHRQRRPSSPSPPIPQLPAPPIPSQQQQQQQEQQVEREKPQQEQQQQQKPQDPGPRAGPCGRDLHGCQQLMTPHRENVPLIPQLPSSSPFSPVQRQEQEEKRPGSREGSPTAHHGTADLGLVEAQPNGAPPPRQLGPQPFRLFSYPQRQPPQDHAPATPGASPTQYSRRQRRPSVPHAIPSSSPGLGEQQTRQVRRDPILKTARSFYHRRETSGESLVPPVPPIPVQHLAAFSSQQQHRRQKEQEQEQEQEREREQEQGLAPRGTLRPSVTGPAVSNPVRPVTPPPLPVDQGLQSRWSPDSSPERVNVMKKVKKVLSFAKLRRKS